MVLKGHTRNRAGTVRLASADARDPPQIDFAYFEEGSDAAGDDLRGILDGIAIARRIAARLPGVVKEEVIPGASVTGDGELGGWVRDAACGHHASCTCPIGSEEDPSAVLDGDFRVRGVSGLRVVDASVFPRIPGFFIASAVYMISGRASDAILAEYEGIASSQ